MPEGPWWRPVSDTIAEMAQPQPDELVADLGCGDGVSLAATAVGFPSARLFGLDISAPALARARQRLPSAQFVTADLTRPLPLADGCIDVAVCHNVLELLPEPAALLADTARVLRPHARAVFSHTDFAGLVIHGADPVLTARICHAYSHLKQNWMPHIDPYMARKLPGLIHRCDGLRLQALHTHTLAATSIDGHAAARIEEITEAVRHHATAGATDLTEPDISQWRRQLPTAEREGEFCFTETSFLAVAHPHHRAG